MFLQKSIIARTGAGALIALALTMTPAFAQRGYGGGGGGYHGGGGGYHGGGEGYHGGGGGYHGSGEGYHGGGGYYGGGYRGGYGGYGGYGYGRGYYGPGIGLGYSSYPSYGYSNYSNYYNPADVQYVAPTLSVRPAINNDEGAADARAHIEVQLPSADAQVFFDGDQTSQTGTDRTFVSPPLAPGRTFHYTIEARWTENGREVKKTRSVTVNAGGSATIIF